MERVYGPQHARVHALTACSCVRGTAQHGVADLLKHGRLREERAALAARDPDAERGALHAVQHDSLSANGSDS